MGRGERLYRGAHGKIPIEVKAIRQAPVIMIDDNADGNADGGALYDECVESETYHRGRKAGRLAALREARTRIAGRKQSNEEGAARAQFFDEKEFFRHKALAHDDDLMDIDGLIRREEGK